MNIKLQDRNLIVSYIQIYLKEFFGISLAKKINSESYATKDSYEISQRIPIKVTGFYTEQTYTSVSLFMAYNYPNEMFPVRYDLKEGSVNTWIKTPFDSQKLKLTMDYLINQEAGKGKYSFTEDDYREIISQSEDPSLYFSYEDLLRFFYSNDHLYEILLNRKNKEEYSRSDINESLVVFLSHNIEEGRFNKDATSIDSRIISYFLNEVVSKMSDPDEIFRIQKIMYPQGVTYDRAGVFDDQMTEDVKECQQSFIDLYTTESGDKKVVNLPEGYDGFKVTGYVDPWTELVLKGGLD